MSGTLQRRKNAEIGLKKIAKRVGPVEDPTLIILHDFGWEQDSRTTQEREDELNSYPWSNKFRIKLHKYPPEPRE